MLGVAGEHWRLLDLDPHGGSVVSPGRRTSSIVSSICESCPGPSIHARCGTRVHDGRWFTFSVSNVEVPMSREGLRGKW